MASILATWDAGTIEACVASVLALDRDGPLEVRIREQGESDEQLAAIERAVAAAQLRPGDSVTVTRGPNVGFAPGHNLAIRASRTDFVLLVNADAVLTPSFLSEMLRAFDDPSVAAAQGKLLRTEEDADGRSRVVLDTTGLTASRRRLFLNRGQGEPDEGQFDRPEDIFGADGAAPVYRRQALDDVAVPTGDLGAGPAGAVEYLDDSFFIYKCDVDLAWRLQLRGWRARYVPAAVAHHARTMRRNVGASLRSVVAQRRKSPPMAKLLSFSNHRIMQVKNERPRHLARDAVPWLLQEIPTWLVYLLTERAGIKAVSRLVRMLPTAWRKRRYIQARRDLGVDPEVWFR
jgi:GT2 family glycosyltransferase